MQASPGVAREEPAVGRLASASASNAELAAHSIFKEFGLAMPIPISSENLETCKDFPYLKFSDWVRVLGKADMLEHLTGQKSFATMKVILTEFWKRYRALYPNHEVFRLADSGVLDLSCTIPVYTHKDEGRSSKKKPIMILTTQGALGKGTAAQRRRNARGVIKHTVKTTPMKMNFIGHTYTTRYMFMAMPRSVYKHCPDTFFTMLKLYASDMKSLAYDGVDVGRGNRIWVASLGSKGDWPAHVKSAGLKRSFQNVPKRATSKTPCSGICHLCLAGTEDFEEPENAVPFEDFGFLPEWLDTCNVKDPWVEEPAELEIPHDTSDKPSYFKPDFWHNLSLGAGKTRAANFCVMFNPLAAGTSVETRFEDMTADFNSHCSLMKRSAYMKEINREKVGFLKHVDFPDGHWSKGDVTTSLMLWMEKYGAQKIAESGSSDEILITMETCYN